MTFEEFQQLCNQATPATPAVSPCPISVGDDAAPVQSSIGDTPFHQLVVYRMQPDNTAIQAIYNSVTFTFDALNNKTVITPITTGAGA